MGYDFLLHEQPRRITALREIIVADKGAHSPPRRPPDRRGRCMARLDRWLVKHARHGGTVRIGSSVLCRCGMVVVLTETSHG